MFMPLRSSRRKEVSSFSADELVIFLSRSLEPHADLILGQGSSVKGDEVRAGHKELTVYFGVNQRDHLLVFGDFNLEIVVHICDATQLTF